MSRAASLLLLLLLSLLPFPAAAQTVTGNLTQTRTSGVAPLAVYFDAKGTTCSGGCDSFHDLHYVWDFDDDPEAVWAITGKPKNIAYGPISAHVFDAAGTYTVSVTITSASGGTDTEQVTITVTDPTTVYAGTLTACFANSGPFTGCPSGASQTTTSSSSSVQSACTSGKRVLLKRGSTFSGSIQCSGSGGTLGAFGDGAKPVVVQSSANGLSLAANASDWRTMDIQVQGSNSSSHIVVGADHEINNWLIYRLSNVQNGGTLRGFTLSCSSVEFFSEPLPTGLFLVDSDFRDMGGNGVFACGRQSAHLGTWHDQQDNGHGTRWTHFDGLVISNNRFENQASANNALTLRSSPPSDPPASGFCGWCGESARYAVISDNILRTSDDQSMQFVASNSGSSAIPTAHDIIAERNYFTTGEVNHGPQLAITTSNVTRVTIRNNIVQQIANQLYRGIEGGGASNDKCYGNTFYTNDTTSAIMQGCKDFDVCNNNLMYVPNASGTKNLTLNCTTSQGNLVASANPFTAVPIVKDDINAFTLGSSTTPKDAGVSTPWNPIDFYMTTRTELSTPDIGATDEDAVPGEAPEPPDPPDPPDPLVIDHFRAMVPGTTSEVIHDPMVTGTHTLDLRSPGFAIEAIPGTTTPASVAFSIVCNNGGPMGATGIESAAPFAQNDTAGTYVQFDDFSPGYEGQCTLTATPYDGAGGTGTAGTPSAVIFDVEDTTPAPTPPSSPAGLSGGRISGGRVP